jgi:hypothetical protein
MLHGRSLPAHAGRTRRGSRTPSAAGPERGLQSVAAVAWHPLPVRARSDSLRRGGGLRLASERVLRQPKRASLRVPADRPRLARVDDAPTERLDTLQRWATSLTTTYGREKESPGPGPRTWTPTAGTPECVCQPSPSWRAPSSTPSSSAQKRRARSGSSAGNSMSDSGEPDTAQTITPLGQHSLALAALGSTPTLRATAKLGPPRPSTRAPTVCG